MATNGGGSSCSCCPVAEHEAEGVASNAERVELLLESCVVATAVSASVGSSSSSSTAATTDGGTRTANAIHFPTHAFDFRLLLAQLTRLPPNVLVGGIAGTAASTTATATAAAAAATSEQPTQKSREPAAPS